MAQTVPGGRPQAHDRADIARLDFIEGARAFVTGQMHPTAQARLKTDVAAALSVPGKQDGALEDIREVMLAQPITRASHRMMRSVQEMIWNTTHDTLHKRHDALMAELDRTDALGPGSVEYDPDFRFPDYFTNHEFHIQTGGYDDPLGGYIYHLGGNVFRSGKNENAAANRTIVDSLPTPADGKVARILELGCSAGTSSVQAKKRFPDAEVWATDLSAGMVRYAHKYAMEMGETVHFKQMAAEAITFPDDTFDIVFAHILFHELPTEATRQTLAECLRVLRPGGVLAISDVRDHTHIDDPVERALVDYENAWQADHNGEAFYAVFFGNDLAGLMREAGFRDVSANHSSNAGVWSKNLALPIRVGHK